MRRNRRGLTDEPSGNQPADEPDDSSDGPSDGPEVTVPDPGETGLSDGGGGDDSGGGSNNGGSNSGGGNVPDDIQDPGPGPGDSPVGGGGGSGSDNGGSDTGGGGVPDDIQDPGPEPGDSPVGGGSTGRSGGDTTPEDPEPNIPGDIQESGPGVGDSPTGGGPIDDGGSTDGGDEQPPTGVPEDIQESGPGLGDSPAGGGTVDDDVSDGGGSDNTGGTTPDDIQESGPGVGDSPTGGGSVDDGGDDSSNSEIPSEVPEDIQQSEPGAGAGSEPSGGEDAVGGSGGELNRRTGGTGEAAESGTDEREFEYIAGGGTAVGEDSNVGTSGEDPTDQLAREWVTGDVNTDVTDDLTEGTGLITDEIDGGKTNGFWRTSEQELQSKIDRRSEILSPVAEVPGNITEDVTGSSTAGNFVEGAANVPVSILSQGGAGILLTADTGVEAALNAPGAVNKYGAGTVAKTGTRVAGAVGEAFVDQVKENPAKATGELVGGAVTGAVGFKAVEKAGDLRRSAKLSTKDSVKFEDITSTRAAETGELPKFDTNPDADAAEAVEEVSQKAADNPDAVTEKTGGETLYHGTQSDFGDNIDVGEGSSELPGLFTSPDASTIALSDARSKLSLSSIKPRLPDTSGSSDRFVGLPGDRVDAIPEGRGGSGYEVRGADTGDQVKGGLGRGEAKSAAEGTDDVEVAPDQTTSGYNYLTEEAETGTAYVRPEGQRTSELESVFAPDSQFEKTGRVNVKVNQKQVPGTDVDIPGTGRSVPLDTYRRADVDRQRTPDSDTDVDTPNTQPTDPDAPVVDYDELRSDLRSSRGRQDGSATVGGGVAGSPVGAVGGGDVDRPTSRTGSGNRDSGSLTSTRPDPDSRPTSPTSPEYDTDPTSPTFPDVPDSTTPLPDDSPTDPPSAPDLSDPPTTTPPASNPTASPPTLTGPSEATDSTPPSTPTGGSPGSGPSSTPPIGDGPSSPIGTTPPSSSGPGSGGPTSAPPSSITGGGTGTPAPPSKPRIKFGSDTDEDEREFDQDFDPVQFQNEWASAGDALFGGDLFGGGPDAEQ